ncbi:hypothetical protein ACOSP7_018976 [Xanthoceras sorbifolium]
MAEESTVYGTCGWTEHFTPHDLHHILDPSKEIEGMMNHGSWNWDRKTVMQGTVLFGHLAATLKREFLSTGRDMKYDASTYECPYLWSAYVSGEKDAGIPWWDIENFYGKRRYAYMIRFVGVRIRSSELKT